MSKNFIFYPCSYEERCLNPERACESETTHTHTHNLRISGKKLKIYYIVQILSTYMTHKSDYIMGIVVHVNYVAHVPSSVILLMYGYNFSGNGWL